MIPTRTLKAGLACKGQLLADLEAGDPHERSEGQMKILGQGCERCIERGGIERDSVEADARPGRGG